MMKLNAKAIEVIETWRMGFVATVSAEGKPNVSPKATFIVLDDETIAFGEIRSPQTVANLAHQREVEVSFVDTLARSGVRVRGDAEIIEKGGPSVAGGREWLATGSACPSLRSRQIPRCGRPLGGRWEGVAGRTKQMPTIICSERIPLTN